MNEYLSKDFIEKILDAHLEDSRGAEHYAYDVVKRELMSAPGADVVLVKHGHWKEHYPILPDDNGRRKPVYACSNCGYVDDEKRTSRGFYCWHCGSIMDGEIND